MISNLIKYVCSKYGVSETAIAAGSRSRDIAYVRVVITLLARDIEGLSIKEAAKELKRDPGGLSRLANKLDRKCNTSLLLKQEVISLKNELLGSKLSSAPSQQVNKSRLTPDSILIN